MTSNKLEKLLHLVGWFIWKYFHGLTVRWNARELLPVCRSWIRGIWHKRSIA